MPCFAGFSVTGGNNLPIQLNHHHFGIATFNKLPDVVVTNLAFSNGRIKSLSALIIACSNFKRVSKSSTTAGLTEYSSMGFVFCNQGKARKYFIFAKK